MKHLLIYSFILLLVFLFGCKVEVDDSGESPSGTNATLTIDPEADKLLKQMIDNLISIHRKVLNKLSI